MRLMSAETTSGAQAGRRRARRRTCSARVAALTVPIAGTWPGRVRRMINRLRRITRLRAAQGSSSIGQIYLNLS
jgi:hypothetical protein